MRFYHSWHLVFGIVALLTTFAIFALTVNRLVRRKLKLSLVLLGAYVVVHVVLAFQLSVDAAVDDQLISVERLAFVAGLINLVVIAFLNPLREDRVPDRIRRSCRISLSSGSWSWWRRWSSTTSC
jgi:hypothetical protein